MDVPDDSNDADDAADDDDEEDDDMYMMSVWIYLCICVTNALTSLHFSALHTIKAEPQLKAFYYHDDEEDCHQDDH